MDNKIRHPILLSTLYGRNCFPSNVATHEYLFNIIYIPSVKDTKYHTATALVINNNISICLYVYYYMVVLVSLHKYLYLPYYLIIFFNASLVAFSVNYRCVSYVELFCIVCINRILSPVRHKYILIHTHICIYIICVYK